MVELLGPVAQPGQSRGLLIPRSWVQILPGPQERRNRMAFYNAYYKLFGGYGDNYEKAHKRARKAAIATSTAIVVVLVAALVSMVFGLCYIDNVGRLKKFEAAKATVYQARANNNITDLERIAIAQEIMDYNAWLAGTKYKASLPIIGWAYPDEYHTTEPIR